ncbi:AI-BP family protein [Kalaharituber pfeilii]|nr:AI-BP family protein [Kalaharituber pfeilii]
MALRTISAKAATALDQELMSPEGGFSIDQLMELAGLSVSQAVYKVHPPEKGKKVLVICGPGNNGGDGLVAARHLWHYGYQPEIFYPKQGKNELYQRLVTQLKNLSIPFTNTSSLLSSLQSTDHIIDAIFGFSFSGPLREPFPDIIAELAKTKKPVTAVDIPSSWDVDNGPPSEGPGKDFMPSTLVSLTAPKPCVKFFKGRHFLGGRFVAPGIREKYGLTGLPEYRGIDQVVEVPVEGQGEGDKEKERL